MLLFSRSTLEMEKGFLAKLSEKLALQDVCSAVLEVQRVCLREAFESSVVVGDKVFCRLEENAKAKLGFCC